MAEVVKEVVRRSGEGSDGHVAMIQRHAAGSVQRREVAGLRGYDAALVSSTLALNTGPETIVQQHLAEDVDINVIMKRFGATGQMPAGVPGGVFGDFTGIEDFRSAVDAVERAREGFMSLPADVRERFDNDPGRLIEFARTASPDQLSALGMAPAAPVAPAAPAGSPAPPAPPGAGGDGPAA